MDPDLEELAEATIAASTNAAAELPQVALLHSVIRMLLSERRLNVEELERLRSWERDDNRKALARVSAYLTACPHPPDKRRPIADYLDSGGDRWCRLLWCLRCGALGRDGAWTLPAMVTEP